MSESGESILRAARQARAWARGDAVEGFVVHKLDELARLGQEFDADRTSIYPPGAIYGDHKPIVGVTTSEPRGDAVLPMPVDF